ncbi:hypothetical protein AAHC03_0821 [Spirometra sp. Aus1]
MVRQGEVLVSPFFCSRVRKQCPFEFAQSMSVNKSWLEVHRHPPYSADGLGLPTPSFSPHDLHLYVLPRPRPEVRPWRSSVSCGYVGTLFYLLSLASILCSISPACHSLRLGHSADVQPHPPKLSSAGPLESIHRNQQAYVAHREQSRAGQSLSGSLRKNGGHLFGRFNRSYPQPSSAYISASDGWKQLQLFNCFVGAVPKDLLSSEDVINRERLMNIRSISKRRLRRLQQNGFLSHSTLLKRNRNLYPISDIFRRSGEQFRKSRPKRSPSTLRSIDVSTTTATTVATLAASIVPNKSSSIIASTTMPEATSARDEVHAALPKATATVHRLAIRSNTIVVEDGLVRARLRYLIQLHQVIQGVHKLVFEIRLNPDFRPVYVGTVDDVCSHWAADVPGSRCSQKKKRFYQNDQICVCDMPPGLYHQRLRINLAGILDGMDVPRFMIDFLFNDQRLNLYVTVRLQAQGNKTVACMQTKLPVHFKST